MYDQQLLQEKLDCFLCIIKLPETPFIFVSMFLINVRFTSSRYPGHVSWPSIILWHRLSEALTMENLNRAVVEIQNCDYGILTDFSSNESQSDGISDEPPLRGRRDK